MVSPALPKGIVTPICTFLDADGQVDAGAMRRTVVRQIQAGVAGVLTTGSCGELGNLSTVQRSATQKLVVEIADEQVPVWAGVGGLGTGEVVANAKAAQDAGVDVILVLQPSYFEASDSELRRHYEAVSAAVQIPILAYDIPQRVPRKLPAGLVIELAQDGVISGLKDSSGDLNAGRAVCAATAELESFAPYIGSETSLDVGYAMGFQGAVPGYANVFPLASVRLWDSLSSDLQAEIESDLTVFRTLDEFSDIVLNGASFPSRVLAAIKVATAIEAGLTNHTMSSPFTPVNDDLVEAVRSILGRCHDSSKPLAL